LVTTDNTFIDARLNYETLKFIVVFLYYPIEYRDSVLNTLWLPPFKY